jgi:hypothetical protein
VGGPVKYVKGGDWLSNWAGTGLLDGFVLVVEGKPEGMDKTHSGKLGLPDF